MPLDTVPFLDLTAAYEGAKSDLDAAVARVTCSGMYLLGAELSAFEDAYARFCGAERCVGVANGLDALHLAMRALGVGPGDEVIVPANTYIATWLAVSQCRATIVPVDPDPATYNICRDCTEPAITPRTKVILPVHLYGQPADMDPILDLARERGIHVLDDCAQAHAATYRGRRVGSLADISAWSFYPGKNLGAFGDAGAVTSDDARLADAVRTLGNYGSRVKYHNEIKGVNSRLDELQAAVLAVKLSRLDVATSRRRAVAASYLAGLRDLPLTLPHVPSYAEPAWHLFVIRHRARDELQKRLAEQGIGTLIHYPVPPHRQPAYSELGWGAGRFPVSEAIHAEVLSLPIWPEMTEAMVQRVIEAVRASA